MTAQGDASGVWNRYGPSAARPPDVRGRLDAPATDAHSHMAVVEAFGFVAARTPPPAAAARGASQPETTAILQMMGRDRHSRMTGLAERLVDMDEMGVARQVILPSPMQCYADLPAEVGVPACRMVNDGLAAYAAERPDRFQAFGTLPLQSPVDAIAEMERCVTGLGFRGFEILTRFADKELSDPSLEPVWARAAALGVLIVIHPNGFSHRDRLARFYLNNTIGNPLETTIALHHLILDGVLERHPDLKILSVHGGGYIAAYAGRMDHAWGARSDARGGLRQPPSTYLKRIFVDTVVFEPGQLAALVRAFGSDKVILGTDYPFDMGEYDPLGLLFATDLPAGAREAIAGGNLERLLARP
jgi:aminocarboxymuconate-semialdehyde decarboxylase